MTVLVLAAAAAVAGCEKKPADSAESGTGLPVRAAAIGEFTENPLLAFVPADTAYAFATFKPFPIEPIRRMSAAMVPLLRRMIELSPAASNRTPEQERISKDLLDALEHLDAKTIDDAGFSTKGKWAFYGLGGYPVARIELTSGDRVFDLVQRAATRWGKTLPPATERAGRRYWIIDDPKISVMVAIGPKEGVMTIAPRALIDANLATLLGEQKPASSMTMAQFRAIAERDGFTGQGVGFLDIARVGALVTAATGLSPACGTAIAGLAQRMPRLAIGYDDVTTRQMGFGIVLELAPELITELRGLAGPLAGLDKVLAAKSIMAMAVAANVEHGRTLLGRVAGVLQAVGQQCQSSGMVSAMTSVANTAAQPLPPMFAGLRGGYFVLTQLKMGAQGPEQVEGFGSLQLDHPGDVLKLATSELPSFNVPLDGKAHALPALIPVPGHVAASETAIGVGLGANSAAVAVDAIHGKAGPAPLMLLRYDYGRFGELMGAAMPPGPQTEMMFDLLKMFGVATVQMVADARGLVMWTAIELR
ncbi:MAG: hypothetical protein ABIY55_28740 [Kofleriaceae bacterium]